MPYMKPDFSDEDGIRAKSTFLKILSGELDSQTGHVVLGKTNV